MRTLQLQITGLVAGILALLLVSGAALADGVSRGALLASMCETCHGTDGVGAKPMQSINGMDVKDFVDFMKAFVSKEEESTIMYRHAEGYTDEEVKALAEYFADR